MLASSPSRGSTPAPCSWWSVFAAVHRTSNSARTTQPSPRPVPSAPSWISIASCCEWSVVLMSMVSWVSPAFCCFSSSLISWRTTWRNPLRSCHVPPLDSRESCNSWLILHCIRSGSMPACLSTSILSAMCSTKITIAPCLL